MQSLHESFLLRADSDASDIRRTKQVLKSPRQPKGPQKVAGSIFSMLPAVWLRVDVVEILLPLLRLAEASHSKRPPGIKQRNTLG